MSLIPRCYLVILYNKKKTNFGKHPVLSKPVVRGYIFKSLAKSRFPL